MKTQYPIDQLALEAAEELRSELSICTPHAFSPMAEWNPTPTQKIADLLAPFLRRAAALNPTSTGG